MPFQIRRGSDASRATITPAAGELIYTTDTKEVWIGDGSTLGGNPVTSAGLVGQIQNTAADLFNNGLHSGIIFTYDQVNQQINTFVSKTLLNEASPTLGGNLNLNSYSINGNGSIAIVGTIEASTIIGDFKGSVVLDDSSTIIDGETGKIYADSVSVSNILHLTPLTVEPTAVEGDIVVADGTTWDPASKNAGSYPVYYDGTIWHALY